MSINLGFRLPYDWPRVREFLRVRQIHGNEDIADNRYKKILRIQREAVPVELELNEQENGFILHFDPVFAIHRDEIQSQICQILDLNADPLRIHEGLLATGLPAGLCLKGLRMPGVGTRLEAACRAVLGQQVSLSQAVLKLNQLYESLSDDGGFPLAETIAASSLDMLKMPLARKNALRAVAQVLIDTPDVATDELLQIKGIGPWTVNYIKMRTHESTDIWLDSDLVIKQQILALKTDIPHFDATMAAPWRSYLTLSLWQHASDSRQ